MPISRRKFIAATSSAIAATAFSANSYSRILGANDRINVGFMGTNNRGAGLLGSFTQVGGINVTHICDVDTRVIAKTSAIVQEGGFGTPKSTDDIRVMLEDKTMDAIVIAAPDHWHATAGVMALQAGKHVYVEKPLSHNPREGEIFIEAQGKYGGIVQMGNQQRSSVETQELIKLIHEGVLGDCYRAEAWYGNRRESIGNGKLVNVPDWLNWDMWQGPAPRTAFHDNVVHYNWHWFWNWGTGELCNNAAHELDIARWALGLEFPERVTVTGGRHFYTEDDWQMYDTLEARYDFEGGKTIEWVGNSCNKINRFGRGRGTLILGTGGHAIVDRAGYEIYDLDGKLVKERKVEGRAVDTSDLKGAGALTDAHISNFLDSVRGTATHQSSPVQAGHISTMLCHLGNIAYRSGGVVECDTATGQAKDARADAFWGRDYQDGWDLAI